MIESQTFERTDAGFGWIINHLPTILWQRRYFVIAVFAAFSLVALVAAFALPTLYRSTATLLIEEPPKDVAEAPGAEGSSSECQDPRTVLSRGDLIALIEQYDLYPSERRSDPLSEIIEKMRKATTVGALQGDIGHRARRPARATSSRSI
jgi:hypothetical protein